LQYLTLSRRKNIGEPMKRQHILGLAAIALLVALLLVIASPVLSKEEKKGWGKAGEEVSEAAEAVSEATKKSWDQTIEQTTEGTKELWQKTKEGSAETWRSTKETTKEIAETTRNGSVTLWQKAKTKTQKIYDGITKKIKKVFSSEKAEKAKEV